MILIQSESFASLHSLERIRPVRGITHPHTGIGQGRPGLAAAECDTNLVMESRQRGGRSALADRQTCVRSRKMGVQQAKTTTTGNVFSCTYASMLPCVVRHGHIQFVEATLAAFPKCGTIGRLGSMKACSVSSVTFALAYNSNTSQDHIARQAETGY